MVEFSRKSSSKRKPKMTKYNTDKLVKLSDKIIALLPNEVTLYPFFALKNFIGKPLKNQSAKELSDWLGGLIRFVESRLRFKRYNLDEIADNEEDFESLSHSLSHLRKIQKKLERELEKLEEAYPSSMRLNTIHNLNGDIFNLRVYLRDNCKQTIELTLLLDSLSNTAEEIEDLIIEEQTKF